MGGNQNASWMKQAMSASLKQMLNESGRSMADMSRTLGISFTTISDWVHGRKYPRPENLERLANYFGVTTAMLLNLDDPTTHPAAPYLGLDLVRGLLVKGYTIDLQFSGADFDFADMASEQSAPVEMYRITDTRTLESWLVQGGALRAHNGDTDGIIKNLFIKKKTPDTLEGIEGLPEDKKYLVSKILSLSDAEVAGLRAIVDQVLSMRGQ